MFAGDLIFELATEEIPAAYQKNLYADWKKRAPQLFQNAGFTFSELKVYATARRIALLVKDLPQTTESKSTVIQGPAKNVAYDQQGNPTAALQGFAKKAGIEASAVQFSVTPKGEYASATLTTQGKNLNEMLPSILEELVTQFRFPRSQKWSDLPVVYARPIAGYTLLYGSTKLDLAASSKADSIFKSIASRPVRGHFILNKDPLKFQLAGDYESLLGEQGVIVEVDARRKKVLQLLETTASQLKLTLIKNEALLDEVNFLIESPHIIVGAYPADFSRLPDSVILSEMNQHQRYFGLRKPDGTLSEKFLIVANNGGSKITDDNIRTGNERVLKARLSDGAFFFDEDLKRPLSSRVDDLKQIVFHDALKTMREKVDRIAELAQTLDSKKSFDANTLKQAAHLSKADLTTALVYEFDHLQGEIGAVYAEHEKIQPAICVAIKEHYQPRFMDDALPESDLGAIISLADKFDNIVAAFLLGKEPSSSQDPLAIRRQTLYFIQILVRKAWQVSLSQLIASSLKTFRPLKPLSESEEKIIVEKILAFFRTRLTTIFEAEGFDKKMTRAAVFTTSDDCFDLFSRADALRQIAQKNSADFTSLLAAFRRMANILKDAPPSLIVDEKLLSEKEEKALFAFSQRLSSLLAKPKISLQNRYLDFFSALADGKSTVDAFFDHVMVNHEDPKIKNNRLALLTEFTDNIRQILALDELQ